MFDINHQPGGCCLTIDIHVLYNYMFFLCISGYIDYKKVYNFNTFLTGLSHFCLYEKTFFVKHQPAQNLVDV